MKPLGRKAYGSIPHLPGSRRGPGDHHCHEGQARIATVKVRDRHDTVTVQEKVDGSCVAVTRIGDDILALGRAGYLAQTSKWVQHHRFAAWVQSEESRFRRLLNDGERVVGEWLAQAHGTRYHLRHEPFVAFDLMVGATRVPFHDFTERVHEAELTTPYVIHVGGALSISAAMEGLGTYGFHGALDPIEGAVWRVERNRLVNRTRVPTVDFLVKYVRVDKADGRYLPEISREEAVWNWSDI